MMDSKPWNVPLGLCHRGGFAANPILPSNDNAPGNRFRGRFVSYTSKRL